MFLFTSLAHSLPNILTYSYNMPKRFQKDGTTYILGLDAEDNWRILAAADKSWWWVHLADTPSAHVILELDVEPLPSELEHARQLILTQTPRAPVSSRIVTSQVQNLRRGLKVGEVVIVEKRQHTKRR